MAAKNDAGENPGTNAGLELAGQQPQLGSGDIDSHNPTSGQSGRQSLDFLLDIPLQITVELGRTRMLIDDLLKLRQGSIIELHKQSGETLEILANQRLIARGEVVTMDEKYGIRLTEVISPIERIEKLG